MFRGFLESYFVCEVCGGDEVWNYCFNLIKIYDFNKGVGVIKIFIVGIGGK